MPKVLASAKKKLCAKYVVEEADVAPPSDADLQSKYLVYGSCAQEACYCELACTCCFQAYTLGGHYMLTTFSTTSILSYC